MKLAAVREMTKEDDSNSTRLFQRIAWPRLLLEYSTAFEPGDNKNLLSQNSERCAFGISSVVLQALADGVREGF